ncbi:MAG: HAMP domain-containing histidine kinase [Chloroflexota bacterium]|nr:HAMP domain-containing histidine kinase [Chloroflexota bacterium]
MASSLATRSSILATADTAPGAFATLIGPVDTTRRTLHDQPRSRDKQLLATVAHELRNPLASLRLSLDLLVCDFDDMEPRVALQLVRRAQRSAGFLQELTENLTNSACVEAGRLSVRTSKVELTECIEEAMPLVHTLLDERGQRVRFTCSAPATLVIADRARVVQILVNLLTNASRYSVQSDEIELHVSRVGHQLRVSVSDHGPGISPGDQQRIFGAWVRGESSVSGGLGLGLSIVQSLVQQHGGRVGVESALGQGATFWFTLPAADLAPARAASTCPR